MENFQWLHTLQIIREHGIGVLTVQEMHWTDKLVSQFKELFGKTRALHYSPEPSTRNAKRVAFINKRMVEAEGMTTETLIISFPLFALWEVRAVDPDLEPRSELVFTGVGQSRPVVPEFCH